MGKHKEPGLEHPGKTEQAGNRATRTGTSGGQKAWTGTSGEEASSPGLDRPGLHKQEEVAAARRSGRLVKDNMNKSKERDHVDGGGEEDHGQ